MAILGVGTEPINIEAAIVSTNSLETYSASTPVAQTVVYNSGTSYTSDFKAQTADQTYTIIEK